MVLMIACANEKLRRPIIKYLNNQEGILCANNSIFDELIDGDDGERNHHPIEDVRILLNQLKDVKFVTILDSEAEKNDLYKLYSEAFGYKIVEFTGYESLVEIGRMVIK